MVSRDYPLTPLKPSSTSSLVQVLCPLSTAHENLLKEKIESQFSYHPAIAWVNLPMYYPFKYRFVQKLNDGFSPCLVDASYQSFDKYCRGLQLVYRPLVQFMFLISAFSDDWLNLFTNPVSCSPNPRRSNSCFEFGQKTVTSTVLYRCTFPRSNGVRRQSERAVHGRKAGQLKLNIGQQFIIQVKSNPLYLKLRKMGDRIIKTGLKKNYYFNLKFPIRGLKI